MRIPLTDEAKSRFLGIFALIIAGEMIYSLYFHLPRYYRPTMLEVFGLSYAELGDLSAWYGTAAMASYFPGGLLADRFSARKLISVSLAATGAGGLYMSTIPDAGGLRALFAFWGISTILLFWAALIHATRAWGGETQQGRGFGLLDGGRGAVAAVLASTGVLLLSAGLGEDPGLADTTARETAFRNVVLQYTLCTLAASVATWIWIPDTRPGAVSGLTGGGASLVRVLRSRVVWTQSIVVTCAYVGYRGVDYYSSYAYDVLGMDEAGAAGFAATAAYTRPVGALLAGLLGDRVGIARMTAIIFGSIAGCWAILAVLDPNAGHLWAVYAILAISMLGAYGLRGLYFALLQQTRVPHSVTGTSVGLISVLGYSPDAFLGPVIGRLLDGTPGFGGYQHTFALLASVSLLGLVAAYTLQRGAKWADSRSVPDKRRS